MPSFAPRISLRLVRAIARLDAPDAPIAETYRRVAMEAERLGLPRPSYERVRVLVHDARLAREARGPSTARVLADVALRARPPDAIVEHLSGVGVPDLPAGPERRS